MRSTILRLATALVLTIGVSACAQPGTALNNGPGTFGLNKTTGGCLIGAALGGLGGSQFGKAEGKLITTVVGTGLGGYLGCKAGESLDNADVAAMNAANSNALNYAKKGEVVNWSNPDTGNGGTVQVQREGRAANGAVCRETISEIFVGGQRQQLLGRACQNQDGTWRAIPTS